MIFDRRQSLATLNQNATLVNKVQIKKANLKGLISNYIDKQPTTQKIKSSSMMV